MRSNLDSDFFNAPRPRVFGHRGSAGTHPENTIASFQAAVDLGVRYLETDVHMTRDGEIVVSHDGDLERICGRAGVIKEMDYADLAKADAGYAFTLDGREFPFRGKGMRIPRLAELLATFPSALFNIDLKSEDLSITKSALRVIDAAKMRRRVLLASEHQNRLDEVRSAAPGIPTSFGYLEIAAFMQAMATQDANYHPAGDALQIPPEYYSWKLATPETVAMAHRHGVEIHIWTVNDESTTVRVLDLGVDGIMTDFPRLARDIVASRGSLS
jgi:glycerophosphoryl diester phosphodiesterase